MFVSLNYMTAQALENLVTERGPLAKTFPQFDRSTLQYSDQLTNARRTEEDEEIRKKLRDTWFLTADSVLYTVEKGNEAFLYLGREPTNPVLNNIKEATQQLIKAGDYILTNEKRGEIDAVINAEDTLSVKLSDLDLKISSDEFSYFEIDTANYESLNEHQRSVAERVYGQGDDFIENMKMFNEDGINEDEDGKKIIRIYVLNPDYVKKNVPQNGALARASRLAGFVVASRFVAAFPGVGGHSALRGVRDVAEGDTPKVEIDPIASAYNALLKDQDRALKSMTPKIAAGLSDLVTTYLNKQKQ